MNGRRVGGGIRRFQDQDPTERCGQHGCALGDGKTTAGSSGAAGMNPLAPLS